MPARSTVLLAVAMVVALAAPAGAQQPRDTDVACPPGEVPPAGFTDTVGNVHEAAIDCAAWHGVSTGVSATEYAPGLDVRRDQMATFIARMLDAAGMPLPPSPPHRFPDVATDGIHTHAINQLAELGIVGGHPDGTYRPTAPVRRDQMASFIDRAMEQATGVFRDAGAWFTDVAGNTHERSINVLAAEGIVAGFGDGTYRPGLLVRRDQMASFLMRAFDVILEDEFFVGEVHYAFLSGGNVVDDSGAEPVFDQGPATGFGDALIGTTPENGEICYFVGAFVTGQVTAAHIHRGAIDATGPPVLDLAVGPDGTGADCVNAGGLAAEIEDDPAGYYVQVHTDEHPDGAVRGQLGMEPLFAGLSWANEVVETDDGFMFAQGERDAFGFAVVQHDEAAGVVCSTALMIDATAPFTGHHIHAGQMDENGPVVVGFRDLEELQGQEELIEEDVWIGSGCAQPGAETVAGIAGDLPGHYLNVHTEDFPAGVARGHLEAVTLEVPLTWEEEVDDEGNPDQGEPDATGLAVFQLGLESGRLCSYVETGATGPFTGAHIHVGERGTNGEVVIGLAAPGDEDGVVSACQDEDADALLELLIAPERYYVNVHTEAYPAGAVRGQLDAGFGFEEDAPDPDPVAAAGWRAPPSQMLAFLLG